MNWYKRAQYKIAFPKIVNWSEDDLQVIKSLIEEGYSYNKIADLVGVSSTSIAQLNKKHRWRERIERGEQGSMEDIRKNILEKGRQMVDMYLLPPRGQGMTLKNIAIQFNSSTNRIKDYMKRTGLIIDEEFRSKEETDKGHSGRMLEWWKQFEGEDGEKFKNRLLSYQIRQQAIDNLFVLINKEKITNPGKASALYNKYMPFINNYTYPDEIQQEVMV